MLFIAIVGWVILGQGLYAQPPIPDDVVWQLDVVVSPNGEAEVVPDKPQLQFLSEEKVFIGNDACNSICGPINYSSDDSFSATLLTTTDIGCLDREISDKGEHVVANDEGIGSLLSEVNRYELLDNELWLIADGGHTLIFHPAAEELFSRDRWPAWCHPDSFQRLFKEIER